MAKAIPIILIGRMGEMGRLVAHHLKPEIEVIHFISTPEIARMDLPRILNNQPPSNPSGDGIGSQVYSQEPSAIMLGLGYYNEIVDDLRDACTGTVKKVPWLRGGLSKAQFEDLMTNTPLLPIPQQGPITASKAKERLLQVLGDGKGGGDGVYDWWDDS